jgi:ATPase subunit of ABC transporter with duplicated ATPase domains
MVSYQYIYVMKELSKTFQGGRELMKDISLSFLPGAKIGVLGANGAGKSTLLKIMAGIETEYNGEAWAAEGARVGYLPQEPSLNKKQSVTRELEILTCKETIPRNTHYPAHTDHDPQTHTGYILCHLFVFCFYL